MNKIEEFLKNNKYEFSIKRIKNIYIYNIKDEKMIVVIKNTKNNIFDISRDIFNIIDDELLPYSFFLIDNFDNIYYYKIKEPNNFLRKSFDSCSKNIIYFGKDIMNKKIVIENLKECIEKIGK